MNKKLLTLLAGSVCALGLVACNSGSSSPAPKYITAGTYNMTFTNSSNTEVCPNDDVGTNITVNQNGQMCDVGGANCQTVSANLNNNPCYSNTITETVDNYLITETDVLSSCKQNESGVFTSTANIAVSSGNVKASCTGNVTLTKVVLN